MPNELCEQTSHAASYAYPGVEQRVILAATRLLSVPHGVNHVVQHTSTGKHYVPADVAAYWDDLERTMRNLRVNRKLYYDQSLAEEAKQRTLPLAIGLHFHLPTAQLNKYDWDGLPKLVQDVVFKRFLPHMNDTWVHQAVVRKSASLPAGIDVVLLAYWTAPLTRKHPHDSSLERRHHRGGGRA